MTERVRSVDLILMLKSLKNRVFGRLIYPDLRIAYHGICDWFLFSLFVMPSYFGIRLGFFDLTALRFFEVLLLACIWKNKERRKNFFRLIKKCPFTIFIGIYFFIVVYTNLYHPSIGTIFYWLMNNVLVFYLVAFLLKYEYDVNEVISKIQIFVLILAIISPLELVIGKPPFSLLDTLGKSGTKTRFDTARIMGNCTTTNGYAMLLCMLFPLVCWDTKAKRIDLLKNIWTIALVLLNVFLTGCRLSTGVAFLTFFLCLIMQKKKELKRSAFALAISVPVLLILIYLMRDVSFVRSILRSIFSAVDQVLGTSYSVEFGADTTIFYNSSYYRVLLFRNTFLSDWLNPIMGRGGNYHFSVFDEGYSIVSIDNFYAGQYVTYAYPGLISWLVMSLSFVISAFKRFIFEHIQLFGLLLVSIICYFISLWYLDQLQTFPAMMAMFAMVYVTGINSKKHI